MPRLAAAFTESCRPPRSGSMCGDERKSGADADPIRRGCEARAGRLRAGRDGGGDRALVPVQGDACFLHHVHGAGQRHPAETAAARWLRRRGLPRRLALAITLLAFVAVFVAVFVLVIPPLVQQAAELLPKVPRFLTGAMDRLAANLGDVPQLQTALHDKGLASGQLPSVIDIIGRLGGASLSLLGFAALLILYLSAVLYITADPFPLMRGYVQALPLRYRAAGIRAYRGASTAVHGWVRANVIVGPIEAVASFIFLSAMHIPGAIVGPSFAFFAEFVPRIGGYVMAVPPVIVALAIDPRTALGPRFSTWS